MKGKEKWISLRLIRHTQALKKLKRERQESGKNCDKKDKNKEKNDKKKLARKLRQAWQRKLFIRILVEEDNDSSWHEGKIEEMRREQARIVMKNGDVFHLDRIEDVDLGTVNICRKPN